MQLKDSISAGFTLQVEAEACLFDEQSSFQRIQLWQTPAFGRLFTLDGCFMTSERDEFIYHENLVHPLALAHAMPQSALVIGGGDGGSARRLLQHPSIRHIQIVELDQRVVDMARQHLYSVHQGALDDARVHISIADGYEWIRAPGPSWDLIVLDLSDPHGHAAALHTVEFYRACAARLHHGGLLSLHVGSPEFHASRCRTIVQALGEAFAHVRPWLVPVSLYGGSWMMATAAPHVDAAAVPLETLRYRQQQRGLDGLRWYSPELHVAQFQLPAFARLLLPRRATDG